MFKDVKSSTSVTSVDESIKKDYESNNFAVFVSVQFLNFCTQHVSFWYHDNHSRILRLVYNNNEMFTYMRKEHSILVVLRISFNGIAWRPRLGEVQKVPFLLVSHLSFQILLLSVQSTARNCFLSDIICKNLSKSKLSKQVSLKFIVDIVLPLNLLPRHYILINSEVLWQVWKLSSYHFKIVHLMQSIKMFTKLH